MRASPCAICGRFHRVEHPSSCGESRREYNRRWMADKRRIAASNRVRVVLTRDEWASVCAARLSRQFAFTAWKAEGHTCTGCGAHIARRTVFFVAPDGEYCSAQCAVDKAEPTS